MVRNDVTTITASRIPQATAPDEDDTDDVTLRTIVRAMVIGAAATDLVCAAAMGFSVGWGLATLIAIWPAVFVGPMVGGLVALSRRPAPVRLAPVVPLVRPEKVAQREAA
jgi:hypothetical protein